MQTQRSALLSVDHTVTVVFSLLYSARVMDALSFDFIVSVNSLC
jgi:hypothetical protein